MLEDSGQSSNTTCVRIVGSRAAPLSQSLSKWVDDGRYVLLTKFSVEDCLMVVHSRLEER